MKRKKQKIFNIALAVIMLIMSLFFLFPVIWMLANSFKPDAAITADMNSAMAFVPPAPGKGFFDNYKAILFDTSFIRYMTVEKNISYGLKNMKVPKDEINRKVDWAIDVLGLSEYRYRKPKNLSGGQRQRVALGRAIVKNQELFLMDEPLSNLDAKLRVSMRTEISRLHRELGSTTIYVTHDQVEAMTMADRIVIMKDGIIQQVGKPMDLYEHPANKFVAGFIGSPQMNFYDVNVKGNTVVFSDGSSIDLPDSVMSHLAGKEGEFIIGIRGEDIKVDAQNMDLYKGNKMFATVENVEIMGNENNLYFNFANTQTIARVSKYEISKPGDTIEFVFVPSRIHFFDKQTEKSLF